MAGDLEDDELEGQPDARQFDVGAQPRIARPNSTASSLPPVTLRGIGAPAPSPEPSGTEDLEARSFATHLAPRPSAPLGTPETGSTADLEQRGLESHIAAPRQSGPIGEPGNSSFGQRHPIIARIGRGLGNAMSVIDPVIGANIPGTSLNKTMLQNRERRAENSNLAQEHVKAETDQSKAAAEKDRADAAAVGKAKQGLTPEETTIHDLMTGDNGNPRVNPETGNPYSYLEAFQAVSQAKQDVKPEPKQNDFEKFYSDWLTDNHFPDTAHNRLIARTKFTAAGQAPPHEPRQMIIGPDGKVIELHPGDVVPQGSKTVSGDLTNKPTPDEQRRADLSENLNENLNTLEEIVGRRPDLFGPVAGRVTGLRGVVGSNDPDIGTLETIKHQIGMAQVSAHGMRSAQGVGAAAESILNSFKNGPDAVKASINAARNSVKTFTNDVNKTQNRGAQGGGGKDLGAAPAGKAEGATGTMPDGTKVIVKGGRLLSQ